MFSQNWINLKRSKISKEGFGNLAGKLREHQKESETTMMLRGSREKPASYKYASQAKLTDWMKGML